MRARRRCVRVGAALLAASLLALTGTAQAAKQLRAPSKVAIESLVSNSINAMILGSVSSPNEDCLPKRKVEVTIIPAKGSPFLFDVARTSDRGGWLAARSLPDLTVAGPMAKVQAEVLPRTVKLGKKTLTCGGKKVTYEVA